MPEDVFRTDFSALYQTVVWSSLMESTQVQYICSASFCSCCNESTSFPQVCTNT